MNSIAPVCDEADPKTAGRPANAGWVLAGLSLTMLLPSLGVSIANVALPTLAQSFGATFQDVQWVVLAYLLAVTTLIVGVGRLGDIVGRRRLLLAGISLFTFASILCGIAPTVWFLVAARALQGLGAAAMMALTLAFVGETVPKSRTGRAMGLLGTMSAVGTALGPSLGGLLIDGPGWRAIFFLGVPIGVASLVLARRFLPADRPEGRVESAGFDVAGTLTLALALGAYGLAMTLGRGSFGPLNAALIAAAVLGLGAFLTVERRSAAPLIRPAMLREPQLAASLATSAIVSAVVMTTLVVGPFYLSGALGLEPATVGLVLSVGPVAVAVAGVPAGRIVDRFGAPRMVVAGLTVMLGGAVLLSLLPATSGIAGYVAPLVLVTMGYAQFQTANNTSVMAGADPARRGLVSGLLNLSRNLGLITGASAMGAVFALASDAADVAAAEPAAVSAGMRAAFGAAAALIVIALAAAVGARAFSTRTSTTGREA